MNAPFCVASGNRLSESFRHASFGPTTFFRARLAAFSATTCNRVEAAPTEEQGRASEGGDGRDLAIRAPTLTIFSLRARRAGIPHHIDREQEIQCDLPPLADWDWRNCDESMKFRFVVQRCETRPARGEPARAGNEPCDGLGNEASEA